MTVGRVDDDVWERIARQGEPSPQERKVFRRSVAGVLATMVGAVLLWVSGLVSPELAHGDSSGGSWDPSTRTGTYEFDLANRGILPATVLGASTRLPGVAVVMTSPAPVRLGPGARTHVRLSFRVPDCAIAIRALADRTDLDGPPIEVRVSRPWGTAVGQVRAPGGGWLADLVPGACGVDPAG